jgi:hypothetical protein
MRQRGSNPIFAHNRAHLRLCSSKGCDRAVSVCRCSSEESSKSRRKRVAIGRARSCHRVINGFHCNSETQHWADMLEFVLDFLVNAPNWAVISLLNTK